MATSELELKNYNHQDIIMNYFVEDELGRDVVIKTKQGNIQCHRILLAAASPFFYQIFSEISADETVEVVMTEFSSSDVNQLVSAIYSIHRCYQSSSLSSIQESMVDFLNATLSSKLDNKMENEQKQNYKEELSEQTDLCLARTEINVEEEPILVLPDIGHSIEDIDYLHQLSTELIAEEEEKLIPTKRRSGRKKKSTRRCLDIILGSDADCTVGDGSSLLEPVTAENENYDVQAGSGKRTVAAPTNRTRPKKNKSSRSRYPMMCTYCSKLLVNRREKSRHNCIKIQRENTTGDGAGVDENDIICHLCGIRFLTKTSLRTHLQMKCENVCDLCKKVFANRTEVREHMLKAHHKVMKRASFTGCVKPFKCSHCDKSYTKLVQLNIHIKQIHCETPPLRFQCPDCGRFLSSRMALKKHASLHKPPEHECPICGKLFHNKAYLSRHAISQHGEQNVKKHQCDMCSKGFNNRLALEGHKNWHLNLKPYKCRWCDRTYQNTSNCAAHERKTHRDCYESELRNVNRRFQMNRAPFTDIISTQSVLGL